MAYLKKNVNGFLLALVVILIICFAGFTYYFRTRFDTVSEDYYSKKATLEDIEKQLKEQQAKLEATNYELTSKEEREAQLTTEFKDVKGAKESCEQQLDTATNELRIAKSGLSKAQSELQQTTAQLQAAANDIDDLRQQVDEIRDDYNQCRNDFQNYQAGHP